MGWGEKGVSAVKANCSPIEWNDSEELVEVGSFVSKRLKRLSDRVEILPIFSTVFTAIRIQQSLSSLSLSFLYLPPFIYRSLHLSLSDRSSPRS